MTEPSIESSSKEQRLAFIKEEYKCISNCEICGNCAVLHNQDPEEVFQDYIQGKRSYREICIEVRNQGRGE